MIRTGIGQDSHRFEPEGSQKPLMLGGLFIAGCQGLEGNSDADVVLHAVTNAISGVTGVNVLGAISDEMCLGRGIKESSAYLIKALESLGTMKIIHLSISIEAKRPVMAPHIFAMKARIAELLQLSASDIGITATSGEGLTDPGRGHGIAVIAIVTVDKPVDDTKP